MAETGQTTPQAGQTSPEVLFQQFAAFVTDAWSNDEKSFKVLNLSCLPLWGLLVLWLLVPALRPLRFFVRVYILTVCSVYLLKLLPIVSGGAVQGFEFDQVVEMFKRTDVVVIGWAHYIAFDMHAAYTIVQKVHSLNFPLHFRLVVLPTLPAILAFGPVGFLVAHVLIVMLRPCVGRKIEIEDNWAKGGRGLPTTQNKAKVH